MQGTDIYVERGNKMKIPKELEKVLRNTSKSLRHTFQEIGSLNGAKDAPMPERNTVVHCGSEFLRMGFSVYAEPSFPTGNRRIDLLASKGNLTFVCEVKTFGKLDLGKVLEDVDRAYHYSPNPDERYDGKDREFWEISEHWGVILIQSFAGEEFTDLWKLQINKPKLFEKKLYEYPCRKNSRFYKTGMNEFQELAERLRKYNACVGANHICKDIWVDAGSLELLWLAFPRK